MLFSLPSAHNHIWRRAVTNTHAETHTHTHNWQLSVRHLHQLSHLSHPYVTQHHTKGRAIHAHTHRHTHTVCWLMCARTKACFGSQKSNHRGNDMIIVVMFLQKHAMICINTGGCFLSITYPNTASYLQEEAAFVDCGVQREALFPVIRVGGCRAADVLPGGLFMVHCRT